MTTRSDKLNRLVVGSECGSSWDEMEGTASRRFCAECQREVLDFAQMSPREIQAHLEASGSRLCARITRNEDRLVVFDAVERSEPSPPWARRRASPIAATLVTAWLGIGAAEAQAAGSAPPAIGSPLEGKDPATGPGERPGAKPLRPALNQPSRAVVTRLHGRVAVKDGHPLAGVTVVARNALDGREHTTRAGDDGSFSFAPLAAGLYELKGSLTRFEIDTRKGISVHPGDDRSVDLTATAVAATRTVTMGATTLAAEPLRTLFGESELIVAARTGRSVVRSRTDGLAKVATELSIDSTFKGKLTGRKVTLYHSKYLQGAAEGTDPTQDFAPGTQVLAFLKTSSETEGLLGAPVFESADYDFGVKRLGAAGLAAYRGRLDALARLQHKDERRGEIDPAGRMEWLVATAEDPLTRGEATGEISYAVESLKERAGQQGTTADLAAQDLLAVLDELRAGGGRASEEPLPEILGASMTEAQRARLTAALRASKRFDDADLDLFRIVLKWDQEAAKAWLVRELRTVQPDPGDRSDTWRLDSLAWAFDNEELKAVTSAAGEQEREIEKRWSDDNSELTATLRQKELAAVHEELRRRFVEILAGSR
jgi:hypothetical protein